MTSHGLAAAALAFAASLHCVGMCGGFVLVMAAARQGAWRALAAHLEFQLGKATTYAFLGTLAGLLGDVVTRNPGLPWVARALAVVAGLGLVVAGLSLLGVFGRKQGPITAWAASLWARALGPLLSSRPAGTSLAAGVLVGWLPCPMVYAGVAAAAATRRPLEGALTMAAVALGTLPALTLVALTGSAVPVSLRRRLAPAAGALLVAVGALTLVRAGHLHVHPAGGAPEHCAPGGRP